MEYRVGPAEEVSTTTTDRQWRTRRVATCVVFLVVCVLQAPGRIVGDTKADLTMDPLAFLGRAFHMWDGSGFAGQVQNQAYGYLFPMGPFFAFFDLLDVPAWVTQRLWWTLLVTLAFLGANTLFARLGLGNNWSRYVGALAYALSPRILGVLGAASIEAYPAALTPWVLLPLVSLASGRTRGVARAAALSALAVGLMGGVNAAVNLAAVLPAVLWFATRRWDRTVARLAVWWAVFVAMATLWWVVPLFLLGRYSPEFLDYIESASDTTKVTNLIETLRGTSHWVGFLNTGLGSTWQIGGDLVTDGALIANTIVVAMAGLVGILLSQSRERLWIVSCLLVGVAMVTFGHLNGLQGWFAESQHSALDSALSPLRNVHKFDVLIRLALAFGIVSLLGSLDIRRAWKRRDFAVVLWPLTIALAVIAVASPTLTGRLAPTGGYQAVPDYWSETGAWLEQHPNGRALLAPGARFGRYIWGTTNDEILQSLTSADWEVRNAIPLTPTGHIRMLDAVERRFAAAQASNGLADYLSRNGIGYVVVRHDLSGAEAHARTGFVEQVLSQSPGFKLVKRIGPEINPHSITTTLNDTNLSPPRRAIEIWQVGSERPDRLTLTEVSDVSQVSGDSESLLDLADAGLLPRGVTVLSGDRSAQDPSPGGPKIVTDAYRRREVNYGRIGNNQSTTLTQYDPLSFKRPHPDYTPYSVETHGALGQWVGVREVLASSSTAEAASLPAIRPEQSVRAMFDDDPESYWSAQPLTAGTTQTVTITPDDPKKVGRITIQLSADGGSLMEAVTAKVDAKDTLVEGFRDPQDSDRWIVDVDDDIVSSKLTIAFKQRRGSFAPVRVTTMDIDGMPIGYRLALPDDISGGPDVVVASSVAGFNAGCIGIDSEPTRCSPTIRQTGEDDPGLIRSFTVERGGVFDVAASAAMRPSQMLNQLYANVARPKVTASVSSSAIDVPAANAFALLDDDADTTWVAAASDQVPSIDVTLDRRRTVSKFRFRYVTDMPASRPGSVVVHIGDEAYRRLVAPDGQFSIPPTTASSFTLEFTGDERTATFDPTTGETQLINVGISDLVVTGVPSNATPTSRIIEGSCGRGPRLLLDGVAQETSVTASSRELLAGDPVRITPCGEAPTLAAGVHDMELASDKSWRPVQLVLSREGTSSAPTASRALTADTWGDDHRTVDVPSRAEESYLSVDENINKGWVAKLHGKELATVTVDGWKQGFIVPAGAGGIVTMTYAPSRTFAWSLGVGFGLAVLLLCAAAVMILRRPGQSPAIRAATSPLVQSVAAIVVLGLIGGTAGASAAILAVALAQTARSRDSRPAMLMGLGIAMAAFGAAGAMLVVRPAGGAAAYLGERPISQLLVLIALAMVAVPWPAQRWNRRKGASKTR